MTNQNRRRDLSRRDVIQDRRARPACCGTPRLAFAQDKKLKVASIFATPIEEPLDHQIHVACRRPNKNSASNTNGTEKCRPPISAASCAICTGTTTSSSATVGGRARVAPHAKKEFPKWPFLFGSGAGPAEPNFGVFDNWIHEPALISPPDCRKDVQSNVVGAVARWAFPRSNRLVNAFFMGASSPSDVKKKGHLIGSSSIRPGQGSGDRADRAGLRRIYASASG